MSFLVALLGCSTSGGASQDPGSRSTSLAPPTTTPTAPDGRIAFEQGVDGKEVVRLVLLDPATGVVEPIPDGEHGYYPRFSPDGSMLAWSRLRADRRGIDGVYVHDLTTGTTRKVLDEGACPSWSLDGRWVVATADPPVRVEVESGDVEQIPGPTVGCRLEISEGRYLYTHADEKIQIIDGDRQSTAYEMPGCRLDTASLSPDRLRVAFARACPTSGDFGVTTMNVDGSEVISIVDGFARGTAWSPDGKHVSTALADPGDTLHSLRVLDASSPGPAEEIQPGPASNPSWGPSVAGG